VVVIPVAVARAVVVLRRCRLLGDRRRNRRRFGVGGRVRRVGCRVGRRVRVRRRIRVRTRIWSGRRIRWRSRRRAWHRTRRRPRRRARCWSHPRRRRRGGLRRERSRDRLCGRRRRRDVWRRRRRTGRRFVARGRVSGRRAGCGRRRRRSRHPPGLARPRSRGGRHGDDDRSLVFRRRAGHDDPLHRPGILERAMPEVPGRDGRGYE
jgi:hypothetical protein